MTAKRPQIAINPATGKPFSFEEALEHNKTIAGGSIPIQWGTHHVIAPRGDVVNFIEHLKSYSDDVRRDMMVSVLRSLRHFDRRLERRQYQSPDDHQKFCEDMAIWFSNEVIEGRASFEEH